MDLLSNGLGRNRSRSSKGASFPPLGHHHGLETFFSASNWQSVAFTRRKRPKNATSSTDRARKARLYVIESG